MYLERPKTPENAAMWPVKRKETQIRGRESKIDLKQWFKMTKVK